MNRPASREFPDDAHDEIAPLPREALQAHRQGQDRAPQGEQAAHPHQEVVEAEAQAAPAGARVVGGGEAPRADAAALVHNAFSKAKETSMPRVKRGTGSKKRRN